MSLITINELSNIIWQSAVSAPALMQDDVQVWRIRIPDTEVGVDSDFNVLSAAEKDRASRFVQHEDAQRYVVAHTALRQLLSQLTGIAPRQLVFTKNEFSKPALAPQHNRANIHFNLSHSGQYVIIGLSKHPIGVDIEWININFKHQNLLPHYFSTTEAALINEAPNPSAAFYNNWTRKEALVKAIGIGLTGDILDLPCLTGSHDIDIPIVVNDWNISTFPVDALHVSSVACNSRVIKMKFFDYLPINA